MIKFLTVLLQIIIFIAELYKEKNSEKAKKRKEVSNEIMDAFAKTDPKERQSAVNAVIVKCKRLRQELKD